MPGPEPALDLPGNYCASEPDRSPGAVFNAPQCTGGATVYVNLQETQGYYDECLTTARAGELLQRSAVEGLDAGVRGVPTVEHPVPYRPGDVFVDGACVADPTSCPPPAAWW